jgi:hypothetical protein
MTTPAAEWFATDIDLRKNQLLKARAENAPASNPPASPAKGQLWFDTTSNSLKYWDGTAWTGGRTYYNTMADDGVSRAQRSKLDFRSTGSMNATVTDDATNDTSGVTLDAKFGAVTESVIPGAPAANGTATTLARSDHSHGAPAEGGADVSFTSWWQYSRELWEQLTPPSTFIAEMPGQTVGGGWQIGTNGSVYWEGDPIPVSPVSLYRNSARVSALGSSAAVSMGWVCYDADHKLLGQVKCSNQVPIVPAHETGILVAQNLVPNPSGEAGTPNLGDQWHSNSVFGGGTVGSVQYSPDMAYTGTKSVKALWPPGLDPGTNHSNIIILADKVPPNTKLMLSAQVYVPSGSPDIRVHYVFAASSGFITKKDQWVYVEIPMTSPDDGQDHQYFVGLYTNTPTPGSVAYVDNVVMRIGQEPLPNGRTYFDGDTVSTEEETFVWEGEPHNSSSSYYTVEPSWEEVAGHIAIGDGVEPAAGESAAVEKAVTPLPGTVYFRPFIACTAGQVLVDTHEVIRSPRELRLPDGLEVGWVKSDGTIEAPDITTLDISPPDTDPVVPMRIGPVVDPPEQAGDVTPRSYVDRALGLTPEQTTIPPQFLWSGDPGVDPQPANLGFPFAAWPLFSQWLDTSIKQVSPTVLVGTYSGTGSSVLPVTAGWIVPAALYRVVTTVPADGVLICVSTGTINATYADYVLLRCAAYADVDGNGLNGTYVGTATETVVSSSGAAISRVAYTSFSFVPVLAGHRYMFRTEYNHGGPSANINRERVFGLYLPGGVRQGSA